MTTNWDFSLSASKLNKFNACLRCFWDLCHKKLEYRGIFPSLPNGLDRAMKGHADRCRAAGALPIELAGKVPPGTTLYGTVEVMQKMRHWKSNPLKPTIKTPSGIVSLIMAFDDLLSGPTGISPLDWKSKGDKPKDSGAQYYQTQLDIYHLAGLLYGWKMSGVAYLAYLWPEEYRAPGDLRMGCEVYELPCDPNRAIDLIERAAACLKGEQPEPTKGCELCDFTQVRVEAANQRSAA